MKDIDIVLFHGISLFVRNINRLAKMTLVLLLLLFF